MSEPSPYTVLGVAADATEEVIRKVYRHLARLHHPDRGGDSRRMQEINDAYELVMDPARRAAFDALGEAAERALIEDARQVLLLQMAALVDDERVTDLVAAIRQKLHGIEANARSARSMNQLKERHYLNRLRSFKVPDGVNDFLQAVIVSKLAELGASTKDCDRALQSLEIAHKILDGYSHQPEAPVSSSYGQAAGLAQLGQGFGQR